MSQSFTNPKYRKMKNKRFMSLSIVHKHYKLQIIAKAKSQLCLTIKNNINLILSTITLII